MIFSFRIFVLLGIAFLSSTAEKLDPARVLILDEKSVPDYTLTSGQTLMENSFRFERQWSESNMLDFSILNNETAWKEGIAVEAPEGEMPYFVVRPNQEQRDKVLLRLPVDHPLKNGAHYVLQYQLRSLDNSGGEDVNAGQTGLIASVGIPDPEKRNKLSRHTLRTIALASGDWQSFSVPFKANAHYSNAVLEFLPSYFMQPFALRDIRLFAVPAGDDPQSYSVQALAYPGQEPEAAWRAEANERIRAHRMADLTVKVTDVLGNPIKDATVEVEMQRHSYPFGTCVVASRLIDAPLHERRSDFDTERFLTDNRIYREKLQRLFNFVVYENDMKWPQWIGEKQSSDSEWTLQSLDWLEAREFQVKGHTLIWASWRNTPDFLQTLEHDKKALQRAILTHIRDLVHAVRDQVHYFDVLNEPMSHRDIIDLLGMDAVAEWFKVAKEAMPNVKLVINDFDLIGNGGGNVKRQEQFIQFVRELLERGAPIDLIGFQSHFWSPRVTPPERIWEVVDQVAELGLPLMVSEFDMNLLDENLQADYTRDFLTAWFSHPQTEAFIMWGFWGGAHWMGDAGAMFRKDWSEKPNLEAYTDLVFNEWWTQETRLTDAEGSIQLRAFLGDYEIRIIAPGHRASQRDWTLSPNSKHLTVSLPAANM